MINIYKPIGWTPLETLNKFKEDHPEYKDKKMSYAGRLDPMAEGVLLFLVDDELKYQENYQNLNKEYEAEILLGFSTDSYDVLGIPTKRERIDVKNIDIEGIIKEFKGKKRLRIPPYSSYNIKGKPLFWWARQDRLGEIEVPQKEMDFFDIELMKIKEVNTNELKKDILSKIERTSGDFRQEEIKSSWSKALVGDESYHLIRLKISCSSGTYIRSLANKFGERLSCGALLYSLLRTRVGDFGINNSLVVE